MALFVIACEPSSRQPSAPPSATPVTSVTSVHDSDIVAWLARADSLFRTSKDSAAALWQSALSLAESTGDSVSAAKALTGLSQVARHRLQLADARQLGERALALKLRVGLKSELFRSYNTLGLIAWDEGRLENALSLYSRATDAAAAVGDSGGLAKASINVGLARRDLGDLAGARSAYLRGRDGARAAGDSVSLGRALTNAAALDVALGDPMSAIASIDAARALFRATGDPLGEANALGQLATAYDALGEPQRAFAALESALAMAVRFGYKKEESEDLKLLADYYAAAGDHRRALDYYAKATAAIDSLGLPEERGNLLRNQARSEALLGRPDLAASLGGAALQLHRSGGFASAELGDLIVLAELSQTSGHRAETARWLQQARDVAARLGGEVSRIQVTLAEARVADARGEPARVLRLLARHTASFDIAGASTAAVASTLQMRAYARLGQLEAAAAAGRQAVRALDRMRGSYGSGELRTSFTSSRADVYADLVLVLLRMKRVTEAFEVADGVRGRALLERIASAQVAVRDAGDAATKALEADSLLRVIDALVARLREREGTPLRERGTGFVSLTRELSERITQARAEYEAVVARDARGSDALVLLGGSTRTAADIRKSLRPDEALLEYLVTPSRLIVFVVRPDGVRVVTRAITASDLFDRTRLARDLVARSDAAGADVPVMSGLYDALIRPAADSGVLEGVRRLVVVRHSSLTYAPFAALVDRRTGQRLVQQYVMLFIPSAASLPALRSAAARDTARASGGAVAFAPLPDQLPASRREALAVAAALPRAISIIGADATEERARSAFREAQVVHVATHGVMNVRNPLFSRLEFAPSAAGNANDNGRLETHELLGLRVASRLVFLSGCETGVGEAWSTTFDVGDDYTTLGQSLLYAGARNVIATLWRIDDEGSAEFARRFYRWLPTLSVPEALANAQLEMLQSTTYRAPYFWAAFEVVGDGR